jgi:hypothetical protein
MRLSPPSPASVTVAADLEPHLTMRKNVAKHEFPKIGQVLRRCGPAHGHAPATRPTVRRLRSATVLQQGQRGARRPAKRPFADH